MYRIHRQLPALLMAFGAFLSHAHGEDWPTYRHDAQRSGTTSERLVPTDLGEAWVWASGQLPNPAWTAPARWDAYARIRGLRAMRDYDSAFHPIVVGDAVFFGSSVDDSLRCLDLRTGKPRWRFTTDAPIRVAPTHADGKLYFGSDDGCAYCISASDGKLVWKYRPTVGAEQILHNGRLISLWPCRSGVVVEGRIAYCAFSMLPWKDSYLCAVDARTGRVEGEGCFARKLGQGYTLEGSLLVSPSGIVASQGRVPPMRFRLADGAPGKPLKVGGGGSFLSSFAKSKLIHGPGNKTGWLTITDLSTNKTMGSINGKNAAVADDRALYLLSDTHLEAKNPNGRTTLWSVRCDCPHDVILAGGVLFVAGDDKVAAYQSRDGQLLWKTSVRGRAKGLVVSNGSLLVATDEGAIHCFRVGGKKVSPVANREKPIAEPPRFPAKDPTLVGHWMVYPGMSNWVRRPRTADKTRLLPDLAGKSHGNIEGDVRIRRVGSVQALELDGSTNSVMIDTDHKKVGLPTKAIAVEAWVRVDRAEEWGGIFGAIQDNGNYERGWLLGFRGTHFCFALAAKGGPDRLNYLTSPNELPLGSWCHVVGTYDGAEQRLYVNGELAGSSKEQSGEIQYPPQAFVELGAYHDKDEYFRTQGLLHEAKLYRRVLSPEEIAKTYRSKKRQFPVRIPLELGPYAEFVDRTTAVVRWRTKEPTPSVLYFGEQGSDRKVQDAKPKREHEVRLTGLRPNRVYTYEIHTPNKSGTGSTPRFELDTHFNYTVSGVDVARDPYSRKASARAKAILDRAKLTKGLCLVLGCEDGALAYELTKQSDLRVIVLDEDRKRIEAIRANLFRAGVYGWRVSAHTVESLASLPIVDDIANLVVTEREQSSPPSELLRVLRPSGGLSLVGKTPVTKGELPGAGEWTHLYGRPDNSAFGGESLGGAKTIDDLDVRWMGRPGPRAQPDRSGRKPPPLSINGRLFVQGLHRIIALDAYNGTLLWELEIPGLGRFNMPRDCGNWCADKDFVYAAIGEHCWQLDAATGRLVATHSTIPGDRKEWGYDWGFLARLKTKLIGTAVKQGSSFENFWGNADQGWYDARTGPVTFKVCSENLFALDAKSGKPSWTYSKGLILNPTITAFDDRIVFVECRHPKVKASHSRRVGLPELWQNQFLVALDLETGKTLYEKPIDTVDGIVVFYLAYARGRLVLASSSRNRYDVYAFDSKTGNRLWHQSFGWPGGKGDHGKAMSRPAIVGDRVYVRPSVMELSSGKVLPTKMPMGGCGTYAATKHTFIFRNGNVTLWDAENDRASSWSRLRPGCWLSTIPAGGMLLSPEAGGGCSCGSWLETSIGFGPKRRNEPK